jgi:hypothetical protein
MLIFAAVALVVFAGAVLLAVFAPRLPGTVRAFAAVALVPLLLFCGFGFLATFEPLPADVQLTWRVVYSALGIGSLIALTRLAFARKKPVA